MGTERRVTRLLAAALLLGLAHALSLSLPQLWWLQMASFAGLTLVLAAEAARPAAESVAGVDCRSAWASGVGHQAAIGFAFGLGWFVAGVGWLFVSMHRYGGMPAPLALIALLLFCAYLALFAAAASALAARISKSGGGFSSGGATGTPIRSACALSGALTVFELLRGWLLTGFPWLSPGYAHTDGPFAGLAPLLGVFGVGALACFVAALTVLSLRESWHTRRLRIMPLTLALAGFALGALAEQWRWEDPATHPIRVDLLQGNVAQEMKFDPARTRAAMRAYSEALQPGRAQLIVMPEIAWTVPWSMTPVDIATRIRAALADGALVAIGMPLASADGAALLTNSVAVIDSSGTVRTRYDKTHLVPFGEFIPWGFRWFVALMKIPLGDFARGAPEQPMLQLDGQSVAFNICYEDLFGDLLARQVRAGANLLVNVSNIAWFGDSHAPEQHLQIARMRARELGRPMLRATNTGVTAAIDHRGRVLDRLPGYQSGTLGVAITPTSGLTPFARWANLPAWLLAVAMLAGAARVARRREPPPRVREDAPQPSTGTPENRRRTR